MTDLLPEPAIYAPVLNNEGAYVDKIPVIGEAGIRCVCSSRARAPFKTTGSLAAHCKTQCHGRWLEEINANRVNMAAENTELRETVRTQKEIITRLDIQLSNKEIIIRDLIYRLTTATVAAAATTAQAQTESPIGNLLD